MMNNLIEGGIYTINDECFVFITKHGRDGRLACLSVGQDVESNENVLYEVNALILMNSVSKLRSKYIILDTHYFHENCDGFLGKIDPWSYDVIKSFWKE